MITIYNSSGKIVFSVTASEEVTQTVKDSELLIGNKYIEGVYDPVKYYIEDETPILIPERPVTGIYEFDYDSKEWKRNINSENISINTARNNLLLASDWTDTVSAQTRLGDLLYQAWQDYRQALRDIPQQANYPTDVIWPIAP